MLSIDDERWWTEHAHRIEANWEAKRLQCWSSLDTGGIASLTADESWSNEGLFAFIEGLRWLDSRGSDSVAAPAIRSELS